MWLIRYMYTSHIDIREDNVEDLLITSRLLQINNVVEGIITHTYDSYLYDSYMTHYDSL